MKHLGTILRLSRVFKLMLGSCLLMMVLIACTPPEEQARRYYLDGITLLKAGEPIKAALQFQNALQISETMHEATFGLALTAEQQKDWPRMLNLLNKVLEQQPDHIDAHLKRGQLMLAANRIDEATSASDKVLQLASERLDGQAFRAAVLMKQGQPQAALEQAAAILARDPGHIEALVLLAHERLAAGSTDEALAYVHAGLQHDKSNIGLALLKIELLERSEQAGAAREAFLSLIRSNPEAHELYRLLAQFYLRQGWLTDAETALRRRVDLAPASLAAKVDLVWLLYAAGDGPAAIEALREMVRQAPQQVSLRFLLAELHRAGGDYPQQAELLKALIDEQPGTPWAQHAAIQLAGGQVQAGEPESAAVLVEGVLESDPADIDALFLRALIALEEGRVEATVADLRLIQRDAPDLPPVLLALARTHLLSGAPELAESDYRRAFEAADKDAAYAAAYAGFLLGQGDFPEAEMILSQALPGASDGRPILELLASLHMARKDWAGAAELIGRLAQAGDESNLMERVRGAAGPIAGSGANNGNNENNGSTMGAFAVAYRGAPDAGRPLSGIGYAAFPRGSDNPSLELLRGVLASEKDNSVAAVLVGQLHMLQDRHAAARTIFEGVLAREPDNVQAYLNLSRLNLRENDPAAAAQILAQGRAKHPLDASLTLAHAEVAERTGQKEEAIRAYEMLLGAGQFGDLVRNNLAALLLDTRTEGADLNRAYELALSLDHESNPFFRDTLGWASYRAGRYTEAIALLEKTVAQSPANAVFHYHLGMSYLALGSEELARQALERALALGKDTPFTEAADTEAALVQIAAVQEGD